MAEILYNTAYIIIYILSFSLRSQRVPHQPLANNHRTYQWYVAAWPNGGEVYTSLYVQGEWTPLHGAAESGDVEALRQLIGSQVNANAQTVKVGISDMPHDIIG